MKKLLFAIVLVAGLTGCGTFRGPFSPNPVVRLIYRPMPHFGHHHGFGGFPIALEVYNPNPYGVLADVDCNYSHYKWEWIDAMGERRFPIVLGDGNCNVSFWR